MAKLLIDGSDLVVKLWPLETLGAMHGSVHVPLTSVAAAEVSDALWGELRGMRMPGTGLPRVVALGTWRFDGKKEFVAVYGRSGVVVTLAGSEWGRLLVSTHDPDRVCGEINDRR